jgi:tRNA modification GTPase
VENRYDPDDTIVAIATPQGRGGIGVVRIAGPDAVRIAATLIDRSGPLEPRHATFARVVDRSAGDARAVDQVVATWFAAPHSYTGDDVVEISAHASPPVLERLVRMAMAAGARLAEPGEFTLRAYLHGRLDLIQAEAVADLVEAVTPLQARAAMDQLEGTLTAAIGRLDAAIFDLAARLEASLDFPDEGFHFITRDEAAGEARRIAAELDALLESGRAGRVIREGRTVTILGRPNAGKSSLFNALVGAERAIVTDVPGTTRDLITERVDVSGIPVTFVDTAGIRDARDPIEAEGVARARQAHQVAALALVVIDASVPLAAEDHALLQLPSPMVVVVSKIDLARAWPPGTPGPAGSKRVEVSALAGTGLAELRHQIAAALSERDDWRDPPLISNVRHLALVEQARLAVGRAQAALSAGATEELVLIDLNDARRALEEIAGRRTADDLLRHVFARFCVGK